MKNKKSIDELLQTAQQRAEVMSLEDVHSIISSYEGARKNRFFNFKNGLIMLSLIITVSLLIFNWPSQELVKESKTNITTHQREEFFAPKTSEDAEVFITQTVNSSNSINPEVMWMEPISPVLIEISEPLENETLNLKKAKTIEPILFNWNDERINFRISKSLKRSDLKQLQKEISEKSNGEISFKFGHLYKNSDGLTSAMLTLERINSSGESSTELKFLTTFRSQDYWEFGWVERDNNFRHFYHTVQSGVNEFIDWTCPLSEETLAFITKEVHLTNPKVSPGKYSVTFNPTDSQSDIDKKAEEALANGLTMSCEAYHKKTNKKPMVHVKSQGIFGTGFRINNPEKPVTISWEVTDDLKTNGVSLLLGDEKKSVDFIRLVKNIHQYKCECEK